MGEVYRARDTRLQREVALKVLPADVAADPERLRRFEAEARAASALNHPNIVTVYEVGSADGISYIAMELVEGKTLRELLSKGPLPLKRTLEIAARVTDGLARAHEAGVVHRDMKPENVMVTKDGSVKILDFGLAKRARAALEPGAGESQTTVTVGTEPGVVLGTVRYMSPEQAAARAVDFRTGPDQRHRARAWVGGDLSTRFGYLSATVLESYDSGLPYEAVGTVDPSNYVANPGYRFTPTSVFYFFTKPAAFRTDNITRTDVALNYTIRVTKSLELFVRPEVLNVFNEKGVVAVDTTVSTRVNAGTGFAPFNPFTDTPVRGPANEQNPTANYDLGPDFGKPTSAAGYQLPRTFRVSVGLRF